MRLAGILVLFLLLPAPQADTDVLGVPEWYFFIRMTVVNQGSTLKTEPNGSFRKADWDNSDMTYVEGKLDRRTNSMSITTPGLGRPSATKGRYQSWSLDTKAPQGHRIEVRREVSFKVVVESRGEDSSIIRDTDTFTSERVGSAQGRADVRLQVDRESQTYALTVPLSAAGYVHEKEQSSRWNRHEQPVTGIDYSTPGAEATGGPQNEIDPRSMSDILSIEEPLKGGATALAGSRHFPLKLKSDKTGQGKTDVKLVVDWSFSPKAPDRYELEMEAFADGGAYDSWRPRPGPDEDTPGSFLIVQATLKGPELDNSDRPRKIVLRLVDVSREKGVSINYPANPKSEPELDLKFLDSQTRRTLVFEKSVTSLDEKVRQVVARMGCYDGGAWGELVADCDLVSGRYVRGHLKGKPGEDRLRIPQRRPSSRIAEAWNSPGADDADDDAEPVGDPSVKGDGLTNYEEYRGFHKQGVWKEGDPNKKDFFVRDETSGLAEPGIARFASLSKLEVHRLKKNEFPSDRIINKNRTEGPHRKDQYGVKIVHDSTFGDQCEAQPRMSARTPRNIDQVVVGSVPSGGDPASISYLASSVAHELFHCVNVAHHGDFQDEGRKIIVKGPVGPRDGNLKITAFDETGKNITASFPYDVGGATWVHELNRKGGRSSGDMDCVMRYDTAFGIYDPTTPGVRVIFSDGNNSERLGSGLCTAKDGTPPNVRFGPATRGNCAAQIHVNDAIPPKVR